MNTFFKNFLGTFWFRFAPATDCLQSCHCNYYATETAFVWVYVIDFTITAVFSLHLKTENIIALVCKEFQMKLISKFKCLLVAETAHKLMNLSQINILLSVVKDKGVWFVELPTPAY